MTLLYFSWNSLWFGWKFHLHLKRNCHLCFLRFLPDHSYSLAISLARFPSNFLPHSLPSSWNGYDWFPPLFCAWACRKRYLTPGPLFAKTKMADSSFALPSVADKFRYGPGDVKFYSRSDVSTCSCSQKSYRHVHCPCSDWNWRATDRSTELF